MVEVEMKKVMKMKSVQMSVEKPLQFDLKDVLELLDLVNLTTEGVSDNLDHFFVVKENGTIVGCAGVEVYEKIGLLRSLAIHPDHQKSGLGTELTEKLLTYAEDMGIQELYLLTSTARKFFEKFEFKLLAKDDLKPIIKRSPNFSHSCEDAMKKELITTVEGY